MITVIVTLLIAVLIVVSVAPLLVTDDVRDVVAL